jgi:hypothetical protein
MAHKRAAEEGIFETVGKAVDESMAMAAALRTGKLTRSQFDAWYSKRSREGATLIVNLRERTTRILQPVEAALEQGRHVLQSVEPEAPRRAHRRRAAPASARNPARRG